MVVLDTDYDTYMIMYKCREELRLPNQEFDDLMPGGEHYREMVEEFDHNKHPIINANRSVEFHGEDERFIALQQRIRQDDLGSMNDADLQNEIDEFLEIDPTHNMHFPHNEITIDHWRKVRHHYTIEHAEDYQPPDDMDPDVEKWFNSL